MLHLTVVSFGKDPIEHTDAGRRSTREEDTDLAARGPGLGRAADRGRVVHQAGLDDHVLGIALEIDAEDPGRLEGDHPIPGVVPVAPVLIVDRERTAAGR